MKSEEVVVIVGFSRSKYFHEFGLIKETRDAKLGSMKREQLMPCEPINKTNNGFMHVFIKGTSTTAKDRRTISWLYFYGFELEFQI